MSPPSRQPFRLPWALTAALGVLALLFVTIALFVAKPWEKEALPAPEARITSLAVLPLENLSGDPEQDYYAAGITDGLIADLGRISALRVISRQSVMRYRDSDKSLPEIAKELGVEALIEGSVLPAGDRVRVTAQLVQADPEQHLWAETYERDAQDILELLNEVTRAIVGEVEVVVSAKEQALLASARKVDPEAHRAYLLGMFHLDRHVPAEIMKAAEYFHQAIEIDPSYAPAWAGLAAYHLGLELWALPPGAEDLRREASIQADAALQKAIELDDSLSTVHTLMGQVHTLRNWDWPRAEIELKRAIELSPNDSTPHIWYAWFLTAMGRHEEAAPLAALAEQLDPLSYLVHRVRADIHYYTRNFELSVLTYEKSLELAPENSYAYGQMGTALAAMGRFDEAIKAWQTGARLGGNEALADMYEGKSFVETAHLWLRETSSASGPAVFAGVHARIGEYEEALEWLEKGYATKEDPGKTAGWMFPFLGVEPAFEPMHSDPRFQDLLQRMNLAD